jgi:N-methylhydantoinase A
VTGEQHKLRAGVDIGGTFTDLFIVDDATGEFIVGKTLTTPDDPSLAVETTLADAAVTTATLAQVVHGTTLVTNAIIERKGASTALLTTDGFRDALEIGKEARYDLYDLDVELPAPLVARRLRFDVPERTLADGTISRELDSGFVERLARELVDAGVEAVAIVFLHSFANAASERAARDAIRRAAPTLRVAISSEVVPEIREFERASTTVANVYVQGRTEQYLARLEKRLRDRGFTGSLHLMLSSGGIATPGTAKRFPIRLLESGPAAGALAAATIGGHRGDSDLLSFDMGGTTAKFCVIDQGRPVVAREFEVDRRYRFKKGSGLPVKVPVIEMIEIGSGGGSIARVDTLGLLKVGPDSSGADPGPACYGRGGGEPTVTDADLVLGYLDPDYFLGGRMRLDTDRARDAVRRRAAEPLGLSVEQAAWGIHQVVNESMANAARIHTLERGKDPRTLPVFVFGGAGPVHGYRVAVALGAPRLIVPVGAGVTSAMGFLSAPTAFDFARSWPVRLDSIDWRHAEALFAEMRQEAQTLLADAGITADQTQYRLQADLRYAGQGHEVRVDLPPPPLVTAAVVAAFESEYRRLYGRLGPPVALEAITWRLVATGPTPTVTLRGQTTPAGSRHRKSDRLAWFPERGGLTATAVYDRYALTPGDTLAGPAIIEERESTVIVGPDRDVVIDPHRNLVVDL